MSYICGAAAYYILKGKTPYFKTLFRHSILCVGGTFAAALMAERLASELYYNKLLI
jgi:hypothetical protein